MDAAAIDALQAQNAYLKQRCAQLEGDVSDLGAQVMRLTQQLERFSGRRDHPSFPTGGQ
jgi:hypothetical protein